MPKKQKKKTNLFTHNWKAFAIALVLTLLAVGVTAQVAFDVMVWREQKLNATFRMRTLIGDAIDGLTNLKKQPDANNQIPEARLQLPAETDEVSKVIYQVDKTYDDNGTATGVDDIMVTTKSLSSIATGKFNGATDLDSLFEQVPESQSCVRGFTLQFKQMKDLGKTFSLSGTVSLHDGRMLYIYREPACKLPGVNDLEKYLLQAQSY